MAGKRGDTLTPAQEKACREYVKNGNNQAEAFRSAYPKSRKWKQEAVWSNSSALFAKHRVRVRLTELQAPAVHEAQVTGSRILQEAARLAMFDPRKLQDGDGNWLPMKEWPDDVAACVASIETDVDLGGRPFISKVRFWDKNSAIEKMMKNKGLFEADNRQRSAQRIAELSPADQDALLRKLNERFGRVGGEPVGQPGERVTH